MAWVDRLHFFRLWFAIELVGTPFPGFRDRVGLDASIW